MEDDVIQQFAEISTNCRYDGFGANPIDESDESERQRWQIWRRLGFKYSDGRVTGAATPV
ncbi:unnamed protein product [Cuscuta europaea]|uniref:Uncharacterized protein n=1 Tax=Cuscuta europaea TaxID=41803 RepID=A0A9P0ZIM2_CUSEU|nr:unnamed protein product [Cuscuta europaea]